MSILMTGNKSLHELAPRWFGSTRRLLNRLGANMVICLSILARVKSGSRYPFHVSCDLERRAVFAREEGSQKGSPCVLYSHSHPRWVPTDAATASYHKLSSQPRGKCWRLITPKQALFGKRDQLIWLNDNVDWYLTPREAWDILERMRAEAGHYPKIWGSKQAQECDFHRGQGLPHRSITCCWAFFCSEPPTPETPSGASPSRFN